MSELTVIADFTLEDFGVPSSELWPQLWLVRGERWLLMLRMPGPGHEYQPVGTVAGDFGIDSAKAWGGQIRLGEKTHLAATVNSAGYMSLYGNGNLLAEGAGVPPLEGDTAPVGDLLQPVRMLKAPKVALHDARIYDIVLPRRAIIADMEEPIAGWVWHLGPGWGPWAAGLTLATIVVGSVVVARATAKRK